MKTLRGWTIRTGNPFVSARKAGEHPEEYVPRGWTIHGRCDLSTKQIVINSWSLRKMTRKELTLLLRHEVAHALLGYPGHGKKWKVICKQIGGDGQKHTFKKRRQRTWPYIESVCQGEESE